jgi:hypothetical protein
MTVIHRDMVVDADPAAFPLSMDPALDDDDAGLDLGLVLRLARSRRSASVP